MNLAVNELLKDEQNGKTFRVLWIDEGNVIAYLIDIHDSKAFPLVHAISELIDEIVQDELTKVKNDPYSFNQNQSEKNLDKRDKAWTVIEKMTRDEPAIYDKKKRSKWVKQAMDIHGVNYLTVHKYLRRYWQRGKTPNALLPDYYKSGGKGKERAANSKKRGRPRKYQSQGINVDEQTKKLFRISIEKYYLTTRKNNLSEAFNMMIKEFYAEDYYDKDGIKKLVVKEQEKLPTLTQFRYWYNKEYNVQESMMARQGRKKYEKDFRAVLGSSTTEAVGPGSRYQIDATVGDVYLISRYNADWIIGRPVIYLVIDVFSRMITGMYIGLEGPSWIGAMMALANVATDKQQFCQQHGIDIPKEAWPVHHLPDALLADRGELEGSDVDRLVSAFNMRVENAAPYRADWKGIVEKQFDTIQRKIKPFLPGYVDKDFQERGARDYRLDAKLTIEQFTQLIIQQVIYYNTKHYLKDYLRDEDMIQDEVKPLPLELWNWGIQNRSGKLRHFPEDLIKLHLLPQGQATVTYKGIKFKGMFYSCDRALKESWFPTARQKGSWKTTVSYDPRDMSTLYLLNGDQHTFETCYLLEHQKRYEHKTLEEIHYLIEHEKRMSDQANHGQLQKEVDFINDAEAIIKPAMKTAREQQSESTSKAQKTGDIKKHRKNEREIQRKEDVFSLSKDKKSNHRAADVVPFQQNDTNERRYARPSIKERGLWHKRKEGDDDE
ncbi:Mu transposase C-terminal domain-containing protein [Halobacillus ihumii]|uniref:Mu transposase C-terminal domain-containing protein n=1 Tax=Halobacillus ihumii TaxID=2686092 RepID=UPI0013D1E408|nr:Mu transposase C-terminal domain-containing protein [Halobacillus ihumii]